MQMAEHGVAAACHHHAPAWTRAGYAAPAERLPSASHSACLQLTPCTQLLLFSVSTMHRSSAASAAPALLRPLLQQDPALRPTARELHHVLRDADGQGVSGLEVRAGGAAGASHYTAFVAGSQKDSREFVVNITRLDFDTIVIIELN